jgi:hypothetical protein
VQLNKDETQLVINSTEKTYIWNIITGEQLQLCQPNGDGKKLVTTSGRTAYICNATTGQQLQLFHRNYSISRG